MAEVVLFNVEADVGIPISHVRSVVTQIMVPQTADVALITVSAIAINLVHLLPILRFHFVVRLT